MNTKEQTEVAQEVEVEQDIDTAYHAKAASVGVYDQIIASVSGDALALKVATPVVYVDENDQITEAGREKLAEVEKEIEYHVGALESLILFIHHERLYLGSPKAEGGFHTSFEGYVQERWNKSRKQAYRLMTFAEYTDNMLALGVAKPLESEGAAREADKAFPNDILAQKELTDLANEEAARQGKPKPTAVMVAEIAAREADTIKLNVFKGKINRMRAIITADEANPKPANAKKVAQAHAYLEANEALYGKMVADAEKAKAKAEATKLENEAKFAEKPDNEQRDALYAHCDGFIRKATDKAKAEALVKLLAANIQYVTPKLIKEDEAFRKELVALVAKLSKLVVVNETTAVPAHSKVGTGKVVTVERKGTQRKSLVKELAGAGV